MKRDEYLSDRHVAGFVAWAGHLVRGKCGLEHSWKDKRGGLPFLCSSMYEAFQSYRWPNTVNGDTFTDTVRRFDDFRQTFDEIGVVSTDADQLRFITNAQRILEWGKIPKRKSLLDDWGRWKPVQLQAYIGDIKGALDPAHADTNNLDRIKYMGSGFSKIYSALIPGLPIYDSRVACAFACLVEHYRRYVGLSHVPPQLDLGIPGGQGNPSGRCDPSIRYDQKSKYAKANLQFAWLMRELVADPGDFGNVPDDRQVDALQSALFMLGYARLGDDAVIKPGQKSSAPRQK